MPESRVFSIPPGVPFLPTLADALLEGRLIPGFPASPDPAALAEATIYLPTQRAARALALHLAERADRGAVLLPRIIPLGEADEAEFELAASAFEGAGEGEGEASILFPPIAPLERRLVLAQLIQAWSRAIDGELTRLEPGTPFMVPSSPADAVGLAADLEALMDDFTVEDVPWDQLAQAVDADYSKYFEITLTFVRIAAQGWPKILAERGASDPARRRRALIEAEAARLTRERPARPIIAAGSTGSIPATAKLLAAIARLPAGAVVLPGLDHDLDDESWRLIGERNGRGDAGEPLHGHPQAVLWRLIEEHLGLPRSRVSLLGVPCEAARARARLLSQTLRPAETTDRWASLEASERSALADSGCDGIKLIEAGDEREEALAIAVALRETLAEPGKTAALVTPDRGLATRVCAELARWGVEVENSAGGLLSDSEAGRLARLAAEAAGLDFDPLRVLALLAHPAVRLGFARETLERAAAALEIGALRGPKPREGLGGLAAALALRRDELAAEAWRASRPLRRLEREDWDLASDLLRRLEQAFADFSAARLGEGERDLVALAAAHRRVVEALIAPAEEDESPAFADGSHEGLAALFDDLALAVQEDEEGGVRGRFVDYPAFFATLARQRGTSPAARFGHRRVKILGLLEARLLDADRVVLGGLDEGVWPPRTEADAFLNRPMRSRVGLAPPERRIGQTAHDFVQALGTRDVVLTRAAKRGGSPTVPSRFVQRLKAFVGEACWRRMIAQGARYAALAHALESAPPAPPLARPEPKPDPALFPRSLSVTEIETLVRDPYSIYARHVLALDALDPVAAPPGAADRGRIVHEVLAKFAELYPTALPDREEAHLVLRQLGADAFRPIDEAFPELYAEWWPRFERLADDFVRWEYGRRALIRRVHVERSGRISFPVGGESFTLRGRADRIEELEGGRFVIADFKTGQPPGVAEVFAGFSPQLTLEAAMLMRGGFRDLGTGAETPDLVYVHASGGREPLKERAVAPPRGEARSLPAVVDEHYRKLTGLVAEYMAGERGYLSRPFPKYAKRYNDYDHLARVREWSAAGGLDEGGEA